MIGPSNARLSLEGAGDSNFQIGAVAAGSATTRAAAAVFASLLNHFVGACEQRRRQFQAKLPCGFFIHDQLKFGWGLNWQLGWARASQNPVNVGSSTDKYLVHVDAVRYQAARIDEAAKRIYCRKSALSDQ